MDIKIEVALPSSASTKEKGDLNSYLPNHMKL